MVRLSKSIFSQILEILADQTSHIPHWARLQSYVKDLGKMYEQVICNLIHSYLMAKDLGNGGGSSVGKSTGIDV